MMALVTKLLMITIEVVSLVTGTQQNGISNYRTSCIGHGAVSLDIRLQAPVA